MTSEDSSGEPARPDPEDWWGGTVDPAPPPAEAPIEATADPTAGSEGDGAAAPRAGESTAAAPAGSGRSRWLLGAAALVVVAGIAIGVLVTRDDGGSDAATAGTPDASDFPGGGGGPGGFARGTIGTISEIDADSSTLQVETSDGDTVEVTATDDTTISETVEGSVDDLAVDDTIIVIGEAGDDGTVAADQIVAGDDGQLFGGRGGGFGGGQPPEGGFPNGGQPPASGFPGGGQQPPQGGFPGGGQGGPGGFTAGTITAVDDGSLTIRTGDDETVTVTVSSSTTVQVSKELSFDDLATGDEITVSGQPDDDGSVEAVMIRRGDGGFGFGGGFPRGDGNDGGDGGDADDATTT
jgi:hypothetical protein